MTNRFDVTITISGNAPEQATLALGPLGVVGTLQPDGWHKPPGDDPPTYTPTPEQLSALATVLAAFAEPSTPI